MAGGGLVVSAGCGGGGGIVEADASTLLFVVCG